MNLGLTGPLNPLRPGNAALGSQSPRPPPAVGREAAGSGVFCCGGRACGLGWQGRAPRGRRARSPSSSPSLLLSLRAPGACLCTFLLGRRAQPGSGGAGGRSFAVQPRGGRRPSASPAQGAPPDPVPAGPAPLGPETLAPRSLRGPRAKVGIPARTRCQGEAKGDLGSGSAAAGEKTRA